MQPKYRALIAAQMGAIAALALPEKPAQDRSHGSHQQRPSRRRRWLGRTLMAAGVGASLWGAWSLGPELRPSPQPRAGGALHTSGAYELSRHPIYTGLIMGGIGRAIATGGTRHGWAAAALVGVLNVKVRVEEDLLHGVHSYSDYADRVPRWGFASLARGAVSRLRG